MNIEFWQWTLLGLFLGPLLLLSIGAVVTDVLAMRRARKDNSPHEEKP